MSCKLWKKGKNKQGYGQRWYAGKNVLAHRAAYCGANGLTLEDIKGKVVRHTCDNPTCVNPKHLLLGTQLDNVRDCIERGRRPGQKRRAEKVFTERLVLDIYLDKISEGKDKKTAALIASCQVGCSEATVRRIISLYAE